MIQHRTFTQNTTGTDFFVGDIHGHYDLLMRGLERVGFDFNNDRLFSVGDLVDRGPDSFKCVELLNEPWFNAVLGNHEQMLIKGLTDNVVRQLHVRNGGQWIRTHTQDEIEALATTIRDRMSLAIMIDNALGYIGVIHAEAPIDWRTLKDLGLEWDQFLWPTEQYQMAITARSKPIENIDLVIHGHVNCNHPEAGKNQLWIDTILQSGRLTIISAPQAFDQI